VGADNPRALGLRSRVTAVAMWRGDTGVWGWSVARVGVACWCRGVQDEFHAVPACSTPAAITESRPRARSATGGAPIQSGRGLGGTARSVAASGGGARICAQAGELLLLLADASARPPRRDPASPRNRKRWTAAAERARGDLLPGEGAPRSGQRAGSRQRRLEEGTAARQKLEAGGEARRGLRQQSRKAEGTLVCDAAAGRHRELPREAARPAALLGTSSASATTAWGQRAA
jgi:hypothetical protein